MTEIHRRVHFHVGNAGTLDHVISLFASIVSRAAVNEALFVTFEVDYADEFVVIFIRNHLDRLILLVQVGNFL